MTYNNSIFIFRRDLRLHDNTGLIEALKNSKKVILIFIFTPKQITNNSYKSDRAIEFMKGAILDIPYINTFYGDEIDVLSSITVPYDAIYVNQDYTPFSVKRDKRIEKYCKDNDIMFHSFEDILLNPVNMIDKVYTKFTPYHNRVKNIVVRKVKRNNYDNYYKRNISTYDIEGIVGKRSEALSLLRKDYSKYNKDRNDLTKKTSMLSAHIKFGTVSIREVYYSFPNNDLRKQLYWRDFYYIIGYNYPHVFGNSLKEKYDKIKWTNNRTWFNKWKSGNTGFPIVDACMTQLNETGYMHNRGRLIVSNFLIKVLRIDWRWGEKYFAQQLIDYDPCVNNGNWQWSSGSGADSQPYFRVFSLVEQGKKHDKNAEYIKHWLPELSDIESKHLLDWEKYNSLYDTSYRPMINYRVEKEKGQKMYVKIFK